MFHLEILGSDAICGIGSLVGAAMLRVAEPDDGPTRQARRTDPAGLGMPHVDLHPRDSTERALGLSMAALYGVPPLIVTALLLKLVDARLRRP